MLSCWRWRINSFCLSFDSLPCCFTVSAADFHSRAAVTSGESGASAAISFIASARAVVASERAASVAQFKAEAAADRRKLRR